MNDKFDELAKGMAQSVTRRGALKKFGVGLAGIALASLGLASKAHADPRRKFTCNCSVGYGGCLAYWDPKHPKTYYACLDCCGCVCAGGGPGCPSC